MKKLKKIVRNKFRFYYVWKYELIKNRIKYPIVHSSEETIEFIKQKKISLSRYGDGELLWLLGEKQNSFQDESDSLSERLWEIINNPIPNHMIAIPNLNHNMLLYNKEARTFWKSNLAEFHGKWEKIFTGKKLLDTNFTRPYMDFENKNKEVMKKKFDSIKSIWDKREIIIVEGENSNLGLSNDLFDNAKLISRIIAPQENAFFIYDRILDEVVRNVNTKSNKLLLISLGPTATILSYDLCKLGIQSIDLGHIDIEYEWFLRNATTKIPVKNKFVNEARVNSLSIDKKILEKKNKQIISKLLK